MPGIKNNSVIVFITVVPGGVFVTGFARAFILLQFTKKLPGLVSLINF